MAGNPSGASAHFSLSRFPSQTPVHHAPATSRSRRLHGVFSLAGDQAAAIYSTRRGGDAQAVMLEIGIGNQRLSGALTPGQARAMARALLVAAEAGDFTQQRARGERAAFAKGGAR